MIYLVRAYIGNRVQTFTVEAPSARAVPSLLLERTGADRTTILSVTPLSRGLAGRFRLARRRVRPRDLELFCRQLHALLASGTTLLESLGAIAAQTLNGRLRDALLDVAANVRSGFLFSSSLKAHPDVFSPSFVGVVAAAEESGRLEEALLWLADSLRREQGIRGRTVQALAYPAAVTGMAALVAAVLFTFVVPKFASTLQFAGVPLPAATRFMLSVSRNIPWIACALGCGALAGCLALRRLRKNEAAAARLELVFVRLPLAGKLAACLTLARLLWTMALLLRTGVDLLRTLDILAGVAGPASLRRDLARARLSVERGGSLSAGLEGSAWMGPVELKMLAVGERSGNLDAMAQHAARLLEQEADVLLAGLPPLMETFATVAVGGGVFLVLLSIFLPIVSVYQTVR